MTLSSEQTRYIMSIVNRADSAVCKIGKLCNGRCIPKNHECHEEGEKGYLVYFEGRRTPVAVAATSHKEAIEKSRKLKKRGGDRVVSARIATEHERAIAAKGKWIRTGPNGEKPGKSDLRGHGPEPKAWRRSQPDSSSS